MKNTILLLLMAALPLAAQTPVPTSAIDCGKNIIGAELPKVDEISSHDTGVLSGTLYTVSEQSRMPAGRPGSPVLCYPQWVRAYRKDAPTSWHPSSSTISDPMPGPTLRGKLGDVVNLTFINAIDANKFPNSDQGCDATNVYPAMTGDKYPDCFADSVFTNVHFHGTHTSPNTTGDNVFLVVRPSPRDPRTNVPLVTAGDVQKNFAAFFKQCNAELGNAKGPKMWPRTWKDLDLLPDLQKQLMGYVKDYGFKGWYDSNQKLIENGYWPQYFVGPYPYCFNLPKLSGTTATTTASAAVKTPHTHGAGSSEIDEAADPARPLIMGQSPGTHWYHAHKHGSTTVNVMNGMTGVFIIEGDYDQALLNYYGSKFKENGEKVLVVQQLGSIPNMVTNQRGDVNFFVNGKLKPVLKMAGNSVQMWRIANTSARAGTFFVSPPKDTLQWRQLAVDGVQLTPDNYESRPSHFLLMSGNRIDLLVKAPPYKAGGNNKYDVIVYNTVDPSDRPPAQPTATRLTLLTVEVTANGADMQLIPKEKLNPQPEFLEDITDDEITGTKLLKFKTAKTAPNTAPSHTIDGKLFDGELGAVVELNRSEEWKVVIESYGGTAISHPFHIHINPFQLTEIFDPNAVISAGPGKGTVKVTQEKQEVVGDGTAFLTDFRVGDVITINVVNNPQGGIITAIADDKNMTLRDAQTASASGVSYSRSIPQYTIDDATKRAGQCYLDPDPKKSNTWVPCGSPEPSAQRVWWDVFPIPSGKIFTDASGKTTNIPGYFKMRSRFVDYPGYFVLHCHILAHEDRGMMTVVEVTPLQTPYSHH
jgi:FtsP/CotA-like multicopper oxidase with cupredoxin domain